MRVYHNFFLYPDPDQRFLMRIRNTSIYACILLLLLSSVYKITYQLNVFFKLNMFIKARRGREDYRGTFYIQNKASTTGIRV